MADTWPLVGRSEELGVVAAALGTARVPGAGVILAGAPGVGKTRLARETLTRAPAGWTVRWAAATHSSQPLPLGVLALLVGEVAGDPARTIPRVAAALAEAPPGRTAMIGVDDAHLLDELSAAVLHHLVVSGAAPVVLTLRSGEAAPVAVTSLWKDGHLPRIDLQPLSDAETVELLEAVLGGPLESLSAHRLWEITGGVALFLRHLVDQERTAGRLRAENEVWSWRGERPELASPLAGLVATEMGVLPDPVGRVVDLLAIGEPLATDLLAGLAGQRAIRQAATRGLITVETGDDGGSAARLAHPLYGELRMSGVGWLRARRLRGEVAAALAATPGESSERTLRRAMLTIDSDQPPDPQLFTAGAQIAYTLSDLVACERLAGAAVSAGAGAHIFIARMLWSYALTWLGRVDEADRELAVLETAAAEAGDDGERVAAATARASNLFFGMGHTAQAEAVLDRAEAAIGDDGSAPVAAMRAAFCAGLGRPEEAVTHARRALAQPGLPGPIGALAAFGLVGGLGDLGHADQLTQAADNGYAAAVGAADEAFLRLGLCNFHVSGLGAAGCLREMERVAEELHARTRWVWGPAHLFGLTLVGTAAVARGQLATGIRVLNEICAEIGAAGANGFDYVCLLWLTRAHAVAGDLATARHRLTELDAAVHRGFSYLDTEAMLDRAWVDAAEGVTSAAIAGAHEAATLAAARHQWAYEMVALQAAVRFGDTGCVDRLRELAVIVDGPRAPAAAAHAAALAADDGPGLDRASAACEAMADLIAAADAAAHAAVAYQRCGRRGSALTAAARARRLAEQTGARTPALAAVGDLDHRLTARQREIAALIARGLSNQQIADRLAVSVRTVESHIYKAGATLGLSREQLGAVAKGA